MNVIDSQGIYFTYFRNNFVFEGSLSRIAISTQGVMLVFALSGGGREL